MICSGDGGGDWGVSSQTLPEAPGQHSPLPRNLWPGLLHGAWDGHCPLPAATSRGAGQGRGDIPQGCHCAGLQPAPVAEAWRARWSSCRGSDLKDGTWETHGRQGAGIWGPRGTAKADQALALRGLRPLLGWDELPALCFGVIYRAAIYIASISAAVWGRCKEVRGEGSSLPRPWRPDAGCPAPLARVAAGSGSVGASLAAVALGASTLQKKLHIRSVALGCQVFFELALLVSAKK